LDADDYIKLPELIHNNINLELPRPLMKQYKQLEKEFLLEIGGSEVEAFNSASLSSKLRQFIQGGLYEGEGAERIWHNVHDVRIKALKALAEETGQPILVAIQFRFELDQIRSEFGKVPYIGGGVPPKERSAVITRWNKREVPLLVCHPKALSHGANLQTGGSIILWYGLPWSLEQYIQLTARLHRQGQRRAVVCHHFVMSGTIDQRVVTALRNKEKVQTAVLEYLRGNHEN
jgi:SNF2 family DNA or RNA helicase